MNDRISVEIASPAFFNNDGSFNKEKSLEWAGRIAGICYISGEFDYKKLLEESKEATQRRIALTKGNGHHSVYDHVGVTLYLNNISKLLNMILNNEKNYATSERSLRYTSISNADSTKISEDEVYLYNKWVKKLIPIITEKYGNIFKEDKIRKLAQENARAFVTVLMPSKMIHTVSLRQLNYLASFMEDYINNAKINDYLQISLAEEMKELLEQLDNLNLLDRELMNVNKNRKFSLFADDMSIYEEYFGSVYCTKYQGSFAQLAQAQRHRTLDYKMQMPEVKSYYVPEIIKEDDELVFEWLEDMKRVAEVVPMGQLVDIVERGTYENFILKEYERDCSCAQLEIANQTHLTTLKYQDTLIRSGHPLANDIEKYTKGARCTFPGFKCSNDCKFAEGKKLIRKI